MEKREKKGLQISATIKNRKLLEKLFLNTKLKLLLIYKSQQ